MTEEWGKQELEEFTAGYRAAERGQPFDRNGLRFWMQGYASYCIDRIERVHGNQHKSMVLQ